MRATRAPNKGRGGRPGRQSIGSLWHQLRRPALYHGPLTGSLYPVVSPARLPLLVHEEPATRLRHPDTILTPAPAKYYLAAHKLQQDRKRHSRGTSHALGPAPLRSSQPAQPEKPQHRSPPPCLSHSRFEESPPIVSVSLTLALCHAIPTHPTHPHLTSPTTVLVLHRDPTPPQAASQRQRINARSCMGLSSCPRPVAPPDEPV